MVTRVLVLLVWDRVALSRGSGMLRSAGLLRLQD